ncbi:MAG: hypothetical protein KJ749_11855, partial [Planctomycetes bacterium]|nr:hypothetical protein [Planctomycetota bacterium]
TVQITVNHPITPGTWTRITHIASGASVCVGYLPGDVNGDGVVTASDIAALIDTLNGVEGRDRPIYSTDIDRSGLPRAHDVLRLVDLLNGAGTYRPWITEALPPSPCTRP